MQEAQSQAVLASLFYVHGAYARWLIASVTSERWTPTIRPGDSSASTMLQTVRAARPGKVESAVERAVVKFVSGRAFTSPDATAQADRSCQSISNRCN